MEMAFYMQVAGRQRLDDAVKAKTSYLSDEFKETIKEV